MVTLHINEYFRFYFHGRIYKESHWISYRYHFRDSFGLPLTVLCHTTGKLVQLAKFCVMAIVVSRLRTTCHQPPETQHQWPLVAAWQRASSRTAKNTFPTVQVELDLISQTQVSFPTHHLSCLISAFTTVPDRFLLQKAAPCPDQITQLTARTADVTWQHHPGCWQLNSSSHCNPDCTEPFLFSWEHFPRWFCKVLMTTD